MFEGHKKSVAAVHLEQLEDSDKDAREGSKILSQQEYVTRLRELNDEIALAWMNNERVAALRLTIKVIFLVVLLTVMISSYCSNICLEMGPCTNGETDATVLLEHEMSFCLLAKSVAPSSNV